MITKYSKFNESIKSLLIGPTKEEVWENLGYDQSFETTEEFFLNVIDGMKIKDQSEYSDIVFWEKNGKIIFEQDLKNKYLYVNYYIIWSVFENIFGLNSVEIQSFIIDVVKKHLNWIGFKPKVSFNRL